ncbi:MAG: hypothetical protein C3F11_18615 [Methylocystaceae bacterium]|nr:MAG: hypothetical protein C3F11_18615 [Methylocystaceae bacterium]
MSSVQTALPCGSVEVVDLAAFILDDDGGLGERAKIRRAVISRTTGSSEARVSSMLWIDAPSTGLRLF